MRRHPLLPSFVVAVVALLAGAETLAAQVWSGPAALEVRVDDAHGKPVAEAAITLTLLAGAGLPMQAVATDIHGRATIGGLAPGSWAIEIRKPGFMTFQAELAVAAGEKPGVLDAMQQNVAGASSTLRVRFAKARSGPPVHPAEIAEAPEAPASTRTAVPPAPAPEPMPKALTPAHETAKPPAVAPQAPPAAVTPAPAAAPVPEATPAPEATPDPEAAPAPEASTVPAAPLVSVPAPLPAPSAPAPVASAPEASPAPPAATPPSTSAPQPMQAAPEPAAPAPAPSPAPESAAAPRPAPPPAASVPSAAPAVPPAPAPLTTTTGRPPGTLPPASETAPPPSAEPLEIPAPEVMKPRAPLSSAVARPIEVTCPECRPGEGAQAAEIGLAGGDPCPAGLRDRLASASDADLGSLTGSLPAGCGVLSVELPAGQRYSGFHFQALIGKGIPSDCLPGEDCRLGDCRFLGAPVVRQAASGGTRLYAIFESAAPRTGRFTVYGSTRRR